VVMEMVEAAWMVVASVLLLATEQDAAEVA